MAIYNDYTKETTFTGAVFGEKERFWADGMLSVYSLVWDKEAHEIKSIETGYIAITGQNQAGCIAEIDIDQDTARDFIRTYKVKARKAFSESTVAEKQEIKKGRHVEVVKGRKVKKGTQLEVFWCGEKETYRSKQYSWMHETELIAGCYDEEGNKVWIKAEYLKVTDKIASPDRRNREMFIKDYIMKNVPDVVRRAAKGE